MLGVDIASFICGYDYVTSQSFAFDKNRYYQGTPNPQLEKLRQGKCRVDSEWLNPTVNFAEGLEVVQPNSLREKIKEIVKKQAEQYF